MRRFLTLVSLLCLAIPAGVSITGCTRNPAGKYCKGFTYGLQNTQVATITMQPEYAGISLAYGQTTQVEQPTATTCLATTASISAKEYTFGTTNNQLVDISPSGAICAGTWNRNTGGGIADYTYCNPPNPLPSSSGLPYAIAYVTATADSVTSNPVEVFVHSAVTSVSLVGPTKCQSQGVIAQLDAQACYSQNGKQVLLCAPSSVTTSASPSLACPLPFVNGISGPQVPLSSIPSCESSIGTLTFTAGTPLVASLNSTNNEITAEQPGTTAITASIAGSGSSAGYFSTCPPASISVTLANGATSGTIAQGVPQNVTTTVVDTNGSPISGLNLSYQSTNPIDISIASGGAITTSYPGVASIYAVCQPTTCNPTPINQIGTFGTGLSITSNPVNITTPGVASDFVWFGAPGESQYFAPIELITGTLGANVRLPYVPNSMKMDDLGAALYFGSPHELMVYSTSTNAITKQDPTAPGVVLAVSPNSSQLLINDQARHLFYLYNNSSGTSSTFSGMGNAAAWTPDSQTLYITDNANLNTPAGCSPNLTVTRHTDTLYVYNANTGWSTYPLPPSPLPPDVKPSCMEPNTAPIELAGGTTLVPGTVNQTPAITIPGVGAYLRGALNPTPGAPADISGTVAHTWCPSGTVGNQATIAYYPLADSEPVQSDSLAATVEGHHILAANWDTGGGITLNDIGITIPTTPAPSGIPTPDACSVTTNPTTGVQTMTPLLISGTVNPVTIGGVSATSVNQVVTGATPVAAGQTQGASLAFITYSGTTTNASLPYYVPAATGPGTVNYVPLSGASAITAPIAGAFSPDNSTFFVSTSGDNMIHFISIPNTVSTTSVPTDSKQISPNLPACTPVSAGGNDLGCTYPTTPAAGAVVPATVITVKPRSVT